MKRILFILPFLVLFFCCTNPSSKESELISDDIIETDNTVLVKTKKYQEEKRIKKEETNKLVINNVQQIINKRLEQHKCDEFINVISKKGVYKHADGTIHEVLWNEDNYLD